MLKTLCLLLLCCPAPARSAPDHLEEKARMEPFYIPYNQGVTAQLEGRLGDACALFAQAVEGAGKMQGGWWQKYKALLSLGSAYHARRDLKLAEKYYLEGMDSFQYMSRDLGAAGLSGLGRIYLERGFPEKAAPLLKQAREMENSESVRTGDLAPLAAALSDLARLEELRGDRKKAELYYRLAVKMLESKTPPAFPAGLGAEQMDSYPVVLYRLGALLARGGDAAAARGCFEKALDGFDRWRAALFRPAIMARKLEYRSYTLRALGRAPEAAADLKAAVKMYRQIAAEPVGPADRSAARR